MAPRTRRRRRRFTQRPTVRWMLVLAGLCFVALAVQVSGGPPEAWLAPIAAMLAFVVVRRRRFSNPRRRAARTQARAAGTRARRDAASEGR